MHNLNANTEYKIVTLQIAVPAKCEDSEIVDGLNALLSRALVHENTVVSDYRFMMPPPYLQGPDSDFAIQSTGCEAEEGSVFKHVLWPEIS